VGPFVCLTSLDLLPRVAADRMVGWWFIRRWTPVWAVCGALPGFISAHTCADGESYGTGLVSCRFD
jgi:hypothetical protein